MFEDFDPKKPMDIHGFNKWEKSVVAIERLPKVTIAALNGRVEGGGFQEQSSWSDAALGLTRGALRHRLPGVGEQVENGAFNQSGVEGDEGFCERLFQGVLPRGEVKVLSALDELGQFSGAVIGKSCGSCRIFAI